MFSHTFDLFRIRYLVPCSCPNKLQSECNTNLESGLPRIYERPNYQRYHMSAVTLECICDIEMGLFYFLNGQDKIFCNSISHGSMLVNYGNIRNIDSYQNHELPACFKR